MTVDQMLNTLNTQWNKCNNANNTILSEAINKCTNINSYLDLNGYTDCGLDTKYQTLVDTCNEAKKSATEISNIKGIDQTQNNNNLNTLNEWLEFNPMPKKGTVSTYKYGEVDSSFNTIINKCSIMYNDCNNDLSIVTSDENAKKCHENRINLMKTKCKIAINVANKNADVEGVSAIQNKLDKTMFSLIGNSVAENNLNLQNAISYCTNKSKKYNPDSQYKEGQCPSEPNVESGFEKPILAMQQNWSDIATSKIESLKIRLQIIQDYISSYPNILKLDPEDILSGTANMGDNITIEQPVIDVSTKTAPVQNMYIILEKGPRGKTGVKGIKGLRGPPGFDGTNGDVGSTGLWQIPKQYYYKF
jgi:hypothetical protein